MKNKINISPVVSTLVFILVMNSLSAGTQQALTVRRSSENPLVIASMSETLGENINGPSVIRVPDWISAPLGKYYMYFAHHQGKHIRLAYADSLHGPWTIHEPGTLRIEQVKPFKGHIASPDVHVDEAKQEIRMYFHAGGRLNGKKGQYTGVAVSTNGLDFSANTDILGDYYFRVFEHDGFFYAIDRWGLLLQATSPMGPFTPRSSNFIQEPVRHSAVAKKGTQLHVFYSRIGDAPERIVMATAQMKGDWGEWTLSESVEVIAPTEAYEGIEYPVKPSKKGKGTNLCQLRDPCIFEEHGSTYLFYTFGGENGIAMAEIEFGAANE